MYHTNPQAIGKTMGSSRRLQEVEDSGMITRTFLTYRMRQFCVGTPCTFTAIESDK